MDVLFERGHLDRRVALLRGSQPAVRLDARRLAALVDNPGCRLRAVLDVAGIDPVLLSKAAGVTPRFGQSPFALTWGRTFEASLLANGGRRLSDVLSTRLGVPRERFSVVDLSRDPDDNSAGGSAPRTTPQRAVETYHVLQSLLTDGITGAVVIIQPVLRLHVGQNPVFLEPDALTLVAEGGVITVVEIKSFPSVDGRIDPVKAGAAARQVAVYVRALRHFLQQEGRDPGMVSTDALLVTPRDNTIAAAASPLPVEEQLGALRRQLARIADLGPILDALPAGFTLDPAAICQSLPDSATEQEQNAAVAAEIRRLDANYMPECRARCSLAEWCHAEAVKQANPALMGRTVRSALAGITDLHHAADIAHQSDRRPAGPAEQALWDAARIHDEAASESGTESL